MAEFLLNYCFQTFPKLHLTSTKNPTANFKCPGLLVISFILFDVEQEISIKQFQSTIVMDKYCFLHIRQKINYWVGGREEGILVNMVLFFVMIKKQCSACLSQHSNESLLIENKKLQEEITEIEHIQTTLSNEKHEIDQKNIVLKKQVDQLIQQHKLEIKELKMNLTKNHGEIERECDRLTNYAKGTRIFLLSLFCFLIFFFFCLSTPIMFSFSSYVVKNGS